MKRSEIPICIRWPTRRRFRLVLQTGRRFQVWVGELLANFGSSEGSIQCPGPCVPGDRLGNDNNGLLGVDPGCAGIEKATTVKRGIKKAEDKGKDDHQPRLQGESVHPSESGGGRLRDLGLLPKLKGKYIGEPVRETGSRDQPASLREGGKGF